MTVHVFSDLNKRKILHYSLTIQTKSCKFYTITFSKYLHTFPKAHVLLICGVARDEEINTPTFCHCKYVSTIILLENNWAHKSSTQIYGIIYKQIFGFFSTQVVHLCWVYKSYEYSTELYFLLVEIFL